MPVNGIVGQQEPALGIGVLDLHAPAVTGRDDVAGPQRTGTHGGAR